MLRIICQIIGVVLCFFGILGMLTPIPLGLIFFIFGLMFLVPTTPAAARMVRWARKKVPIFDKAMHGATRRAPTPYKRVLRETEYREY